MILNNNKYMFISLLFYCKVLLENIILMIYYLTKHHKHKVQFFKLHQAGHIEPLSGPVLAHMP